MALTAFWLRFAPRQFARGRDYEVSGARALAPQLSSAFTVLAEGALRASAAASEPVWQFAPLTDGLAVLARCDFEEREGARARVIWALALPSDYLRASTFALHAHIERFAELPADGSSVPPSLALDAQRAARGVGGEVTTLLAKYIEAGTVRVAVPNLTQALKLFCQVVESLPPGDRQRVSFSTAPAEGRTFEVDVAAPSPEVLAVGEEARAVANLWSIFRYGVAPSVQSELSLTRNPVDWLGSLLTSDDLAAKFRGLSKLVLERLQAAQHATAFALLRRALELQLARSGPERAAAALAQLDAEGYLSADYGTPPIWVARLVVEQHLMPHLPAPVLAKVLRPGSLNFLLNSLQQVASVARVQCWVTALQRPSSHDAQTRRELLQACREGWRELLGARRKLGHGDVARTLALLSLYEHCRGSGPARPAGGVK